jgi:hypothetical protein
VTGRCVRPGYTTAPYYNLITITNNTGGRWRI